MAILNRLRDGITIAGLSLLLAACQTLGGGGLIASTVTAELTPAGASSIASDMVGQLGAHVGPGGTTIRLRGDGSPFGSALEESLRTAGYAVVIDQRSSDAGAMDLAYAVDSFEGSVMVRLSTVSLDLTRLYTLDGEVAIPTGPASVMRRDEADPT
ncbi:MAG: conjugal transfer protein TrbH [Devosia sp.]|uniref:conjugal transfer protein TrbH n=1 Tax=Devosia sp. TaxID=1871048 RepID=UPI001AC60E10|nr:conjugal transfer protein TrbH [Devosia sp.]MBN9309130.1 conjugal transfer protein TrbH [Devosia sp.]